MPKINRWLFVLVLAVVAGASAIICASAGSSGLTLPWASGEGTASLILNQIRFPRVCAALLVGAGLAVAGSSLQGLFRNPLADPYVIGTSSGAAVGAAVSIIFFHGFLLPVTAFTGACAAIVTVYFIAKRGGRVPVEALLLTGVAVSFFLSAMLSFLIYRSGENMHQIMFWLMGGLWNADWNSVAIGLLVLPGILLLILASREIDILSLGEEEAATLGVNAEKVKLALLAVSAFVTAVAVAIAGSIGFIGLITPHIIRSVTGPQHRYLIPAAAIAGGLILLWADTITRTFLNDIPVGIITAFFGAPFFLYLIRRRSGV